MNGEGTFDLPVNSLIIAGAESLIVDTGVACEDDCWFDDVFGTVNPSDVRWVFVSHEDADHTAHVGRVLAVCHNATVVTSRSAGRRLRSSIDLSGRRVHWIEDGNSFALEDRVLLALRPPLFDSPATLALFDSLTGVLWSADCFGTGRTEITAVDDGFVDAFARWHQLLSPWHAWLDRDAFGRHVDRTEALGVATIASAHGPVLRGPDVCSAFQLIRTLPVAMIVARPADVPKEVEHRYGGLADRITFGTRGRKGS